MAKEVEAIFSDFTVRKYADEEKAIEAGCSYILGDWIMKETPYKESGSRIIRVREYRAVDGKSVESMQESGWILHDVFLPSWGCVVHHRFEDPYGEVRRIAMTGTDGKASGWQLERLSEQLRDLSAHNSWREYEMSQRIEDLQAENAALKARLAEFTEEIGQRNGKVPNANAS